MQFLVSWCNGSTSVFDTVSPRSSRGETNMKKVCVSGGFDPVHIGHLRMFEDAKKLGDYLIVIVNNDNWLVSKKGYHFMQESDRKEIIQAFRCVNEVVITSHREDSTDMSVCDELLKIKPDIFANGGDRKSDNIPEYKLCIENGIHMEFNVDGEKIMSSSELINSCLTKNI